MEELRAEFFVVAFFLFDEMVLSMVSQRATNRKRRWNQGRRNARNWFPSSIASEMRNKQKQTNETKQTNSRWPPTAPSANDCVCPFLLSFFLSFFLFLLFFCSHQSGISSITLPWPSFGLVPDRNELLFNFFFVSASIRWRMGVGRWAWRSCSARQRHGRRAVVPFVLFFSFLPFFSCVSSFRCVGLFLFFFVFVLFFCLICVVSDVSRWRCAVRAVRFEFWEFFLFF